MASSVIGALRVNLGIDSAQFSNGLKQAQSGLARFSTVAKAGMVAAAAAVGYAAGQMAKSVKDTIDAADDMSKAASKIGVPIEELSRLKYAADLSGVSFEGLQTAVGRLSRVMNDAKNGSKGAIDTFDQLGVSATNADGTLKSASQVLTEVSNKFASMPDGAEKTALAMDLMGRSGANMIPLLNGGADALNKLMAEADTFGQVFSKEMGANAEAFNDNISRLQGAFANLSARIATELLPYLVQFSDWLVANGPAIAEWSGSLVAALGFVINEFVRFKNEAVQFGEDVTAIYQFFANLGTSISTLATTITDFLAGAWAQFEAAWDGITAKVGEVKAAIDQFARSIVEVFAALPGQMLEIGGQIIDGLWQGLQSKFASVKSGLSNFASGLVGSVKSTLGIQSPSKVMSGVGVNIMQGLQGGMESMQGGVESLASSIASTIGNAFSGVINGTKTFKEAMADILGQLASTFLQSGLQSLFSGMGLGGAGGGFGSALQGILGSLFGFARGGSILPGGTGGIDSQVVAFRKSPNERVDITKPGQMNSRGGGSADVRVWVDQNGNWQAAVERISDQRAAGAVDRYDRTRAPGTAVRSVQEYQRRAGR